MAAVDPSILPEPLPAMQDNRDIPGPANGKLDGWSDDGGDYCRICRGEGSEDQALFYPCKCSGSIRYVHQDCLMDWLAHSKKKHCELCKTAFRFTKLYDQSMPATLPLPLFLRQLLLHGLSTLLRWLRYGTVVVVWLICLPWCIRQIWRGLFWLADGNWAAGSLLHEAAVRRTNASQAITGSGNASAASSGTHSANLTLQDSVPDSSVHNQPPSIPAILDSFLRLLTGETVVSKILRLLFSIPPIQISSPSTAHPANGPLLPLTASRPPSLLSDVKFMNELTSSTVINNFSIDVAEGLLICLTLVTAFILVFLIREWVINQQPMLNIPDIDHAEIQPVAPPAAGEDRLRPQARRQRAQPRDEDQAGLRRPPDNQAIRQEDVTIPPRRALSDDNVAVPIAHLADRPDLPPRAASLSLTVAARGERGERGREDTEHVHPAPPPLVRGALGDAVFVQRNIEERVADLFASLDATDPSNGGASSPMEDSLTSKPRSLSSVAVNDALGKTDIDAGQAFSVDEIFEEPQTLSDSADMHPAHPELDANGSTADDVTVATAAVHSLPAVDDEGSGHQTQIHRPNQSLVEKAIDWLWHVEGEVPLSDQDSGPIDQELVGDLQAEAAFVPVQNRGLLPPIAQAQPAPAAAGVQDGHQDHGPIQIEWADQNAAEDVEDLEGIFELIGMEGPLISMVQNVVFSLFLITLTLTASVWIPYVWGKLALIVLAHPVAITVRAPALLVSTIADMVTDVGLLILGICGLLCSQITKLVKVLVRPVLRPLSNALDADLFEALALNVTKRSGTRLENSIAGAASVATLGSDLPTFSIESHRSLLTFKASVAEAYASAFTSAHSVHESVLRFSWSFQEQSKWAVFLGRACYRAGRLLLTAVQNLKLDSLHSLLKMRPSSRQPRRVISPEHLLAGWSTEDKVIAILLGYAFFGLAGFIFMKMSRLFYGLKKDDKVPGALADSIRQASGVAKVILIIGIEMLIFPLYCGLLLDVALLPLFEGATIWTRLLFIQKAPFTGLFLHWFIGTCYMFHFALFVSMSRKMLRKGVLYFIRDPDDPTFHPVRDVLERPVPTQLGKIAFSALVYGGLAIFCLGGVVWSLARIDGVLPIHWSAPEPGLAFPIDLIFYNFLLPFIIRTLEPTKNLAAVYQLWFRGCAHNLRLSHFLFGEEREDEKVPDPCGLPWSKILSDDQHGSYVRAPGSDSCRIPKGQKVFIEVSENNERLDGEADQEIGLHGRRDERWAKIYLPPKFKTRLATFVMLLWVFAAGTGVTLTIGPLLIGRILVKLASGSPGPVNDLYALTVGAHVLGLIILCASHARDIQQCVSEKAQQYFPNPIKTLSSLYSALKLMLSHVYMVTALGIVLPFTLSLITELYIHVPLFTFVLRLDSQRGFETRSASSGRSVLPERMSPTLFVLQTWTLGLLYMRVAMRVALTYPSPQSQVALAIRSIWRDGLLRPDVKQATRAVIIPLMAICLILLAAPLAYARLLIALTGAEKAEEQIRLYRYAYPGLMGIVLTGWGMMELRKKLELWRVKIRDEVYLVGER
ncbi:hypothetical protein DV736_g2889, partial [Chaetothyriales sp. CBS 134916]